MFQYIAWQPYPIEEVTEYDPRLMHANSLVSQMQRSPGSRCQLVERRFRGSERAVLKAHVLLYRLAELTLDGERPPRAVSIRVIEFNDEVPNWRATTTQPLALSLAERWFQSLDRLAKEVPEVDFSDALADHRGVRGVAELLININRT